MPYCTQSGPRLKWLKADSVLGRRQRNWGRRRTQSAGSDHFTERGQFWIISRTATGRDGAAARNDTDLAPATNVKTVAAVDADRCRTARNRLADVALAFLITCRAADQAAQQQGR